MVKFLHIHHVEKTHILIICNVETTHILNICHVEKCEIAPHPSCGENSVSPHNRWGEFHHLLIYQINNVYNLRCFYVYYAVLLQNLFILRFTLFCRKICFCRDLRAFAWRKIEPKIVTVEKKGQISCMRRGWLMNTLSGGRCQCLVPTLWKNNEGASEQRPPEGI